MTEQTEEYRVRWYHYGLTDAADYALFVQDDGEEAEMNDLDGSLRLRPPTPAEEHAFRVTMCITDERLDWGNYAFSPGVTVMSMEFVFTEP